MTNDEKVEAYRMRLEGATLQEVADRFGVTREWIRALTPAPEKRGKKKRNHKNIIYPNINKFLYENRHSYSSFAKLIGMSGNAVYRALTGATSPTKKLIDRVLEATDMTYEEAFRGEKHDP